MRIRHKVNVQISDDVDGVDKLFFLDDTLAQVVIDTYTHWDGGAISVTAVGTPVTYTLPFAQVLAPKGCFLKFKGCDPQITLNGGSTIQLRRASTGAADTCRFFWEGDITAIQVIAPINTQVIGLFAVWGDILP